MRYIAKKIPRKNNIREQVEEIYKFVNETTAELERILENDDNKLNTKLPIGAAILCAGIHDNGGMEYGIWKMLDETVRTDKGILYIYVRAE